MVKIREIKLNKYHCKNWFHEIFFIFNTLLWRYLRKLQYFSATREFLEFPHCGLLRLTEWTSLDLEQAAKMASQAKPSLEKSLACVASQAVLCAKSQIGKLKPSQALEKACLEKMASSSHEIGKPSQAASFFPFENKADFKPFRALFEPYNWPESSQCFINTILSIYLINTTLCAKIYVILTKTANFTKGLLLYASVGTLECFLS